MKQIRANWKSEEQGGDAERHPQRAPEAGQQPDAHRPEAGVEQGDGEADPAGRGRSRSPSGAQRGFARARCWLRRLRLRSFAVGQRARAASVVFFGELLRPCPAFFAAFFGRFLGRQRRLRFAGDELVGGFVGGDADRATAGDARKSGAAIDHADELAAHPVAAGAAARKRK